MKIDRLIAELQHTRTQHGNIEVLLQNPSKEKCEDCAKYETICIVDEPGVNGEPELILRNWPY